MDNRINECRRKISVLRARMMEAEAQVRLEVGRGLDCTESANRLLTLRQELGLLIGQWKQAGGFDRLPTVEERLKRKLAPAGVAAGPMRGARR
jgi:hypothetical protein